METAVISFRPDYSKSQFPMWEDGDKYLGHRVSFTLAGHKMTGSVIGTERHHLANGVHDILEIEVENERKQVKVQMHRQAVKVLD
jgi:hypothetical protein